MSYLAALNPANMLLIFGLTPTDDAPNVYMFKHIIDMYAYNHMKYMHSRSKCKYKVYLVTWNYTASIN